MIVDLVGRGVRLSKLREDMMLLKIVMKETFDKNCKCELYTLKVYKLYHLVEDNKRKQKLQTLETSHFEKLNVHVKGAYGWPSQGVAFQIIDKVGRMDERSEQITMIKEWDPERGSSTSE